MPYPMKESPETEKRVKSKEIFPVFNPNDSHTLILSQRNKTYFTFLLKVLKRWEERRVKRKIRPMRMGQCTTKCTSHTSFKEESSIRSNEHLSHFSPLTNIACFFLLMDFGNQTSGWERTLEATSGWQYVMEKREDKKEMSWDCWKSRRRVLGQLIMERGQLEENMPSWTQLIQKVRHSIHKTRSQL